MRTALVVLLALSACGPQNARPPQGPPPSAAATSAAVHPLVVLSDGAKIEVEVAADPATRAQGLMYRESVPEGKGMLFLFPGPPIVQPFWMKNTIVPLDIIWIGSDFRVVHIATNVPPCPGDPCPSYSPGAAASYVLELRAGGAGAHRLKTGDAVEFRNLEGIRVE